MEKNEQIKRLMEQLEAIGEALNGMKRSVTSAQLVEEENDCIVTLTDLGVELPISPHRLHSARNHTALVKLGLTGKDYDKTLAYNLSQCPPCVAHEAEVKALLQAHASKRDAF